MADLADLGFNVNTGDLERAARVLDELERRGRAVEQSGRGAGRGLDEGMRGAVGGIGAASAATSGFAAKLGGIGSLVGGLGLAALAKNAVDMAARFGGAMNTVQSKLLISKEAMSGLREQAKALGSTTKFSATEAAEGMGFLAQAGLDAEEIFQAMPSTLQLATAAGIELADAADIATNVMGAFRMEVGDLPSIMDVLSATAAKSNTSVHELAMALRDSAPVAAEFGVDMYEMSAAVGGLANSGIKATVAGTTLKNMFLNLVTPAGQTQKAFDKFNLSTKDFFRTSAEGKTEFLGMANMMEVLRSRGVDAAGAMEIFGREAGPGMLIALAQGGAELEGFEVELKKVGVAAKSASIMSEGLAGELQKTASMWEGLNLAFMDGGGTSLAVKGLHLVQKAIAFVATDGLDYLTASVARVKTAWADFQKNLATSEALQFVALRTLGDAIVSLGRALTPVVPYLDDFAIAAAAIVAAGAGIAIVAAGLSAVAAVVLSPVVLGVGALAAAAVTIRANWDGISAWWAGLWEGLDGDVGLFAQRLGASLKSLGGSFIAAAGESVRAYAAELNTRLSTVLGEIRWPTRYEVLGAASDLVAGFGTLALTGLRVLTTSLGTGLGSLLGNVQWPTAEEVGRAAANFVLGFVRLAADALAALDEGLRGAGEGIEWPTPLEVIEGAASLLKGFADTAGVAVSTFATTLGKGLLNAVTGALEARAGDLKRAAINAFDFLPFIGDEVEKRARPAAEVVPETIAATLSREAPVLRRASEELAEVVSTGLESGVAGAERAGEDTGGGFWRGIASTLGLIEEVSATMGGTPEKVARKESETKSPSRALWRVGRDIALGFAGGMRENLRAVGEAAGILSDQALNVFNNLNERLKAESILLIQGAEAAERYRLEKQGIVGAAADEIVKKGQLNEQYRDEKERLDGVNGAMRDLVIRRAILTERLENGADAARRLELQTQKLTDTEIDARMEAEKRTQRLAEQVRAVEDGARRFEALKGKWEGIIGRNLVDGGSVRDTLKELGSYSRDWLKRLAAEFASKAIVAVFTGDTSGLNTAISAATGALGGLGGVIKSVGGKALGWLSSATGGFGGLSTAANGAATAFTTAGGGISGASAGLSAFTATAAGATAAAVGVAGAMYAAGKAVGDFTGAANPKAMGFAALALGMGPGLIVGSAFGAGTQKTDAGVQIGVRGGRVGGKAYERFEKERSFWRGTKVTEHFSALESQIRDELNGFLSGLGAELSRSFGALGVAGSSSIIDGLNVAITRISASRFEEDIAEWVESTTRAAYRDAFARLGPDMRDLVSDSVDLVNAPIEEIQKTFAELGRVAGQSVPLLKSLGIGLGETLGLQMRAAMGLAELAGGMDALEQKAGALYARMYTESERQGHAVEAARRQIAEFNTAMGLAGMSAVTSERGLWAYVQAQDATTAAGKRNINMALDYAGSFATVADARLAALRTARAEEEAARAEHERLGTVLGSVRDIAEKLNLKFVVFGPAALKSADALAKLFGGMEALSAATNSYYEEFYSETERAALATAEAATQVLAFNDSLSSAALAAAGVTDGVIDTREEFRRYVESLELHTEAGQRAFKAAMDLQGSLLQVADAEGTLEQMIQGLPPELENAFGAMTNETAKAALVLEAKFAEMAEKAGISGGTLEANFTSAFDAVVGAADTTSENLVTRLRGAYTTVLSDAGVLSERMPPAVRVGFDAMVNEAVKASIELESASKDGRKSLDSLGDAARGQGAPLNGLEGEINDIGGAAGRASGGLDSMGSALDRFGNSISKASRDTREEARQIERELSRAKSLSQRAGNMDDLRDLGSFETGLTRVAQPERVVRVHQGEMIARADVAARLRAMGVTAQRIPPDFGRRAPVVSVNARGGSGSEGHAAIVAELRAANARLDAIERGHREEARRAEGTRTRIARGTEASSAVLEETRRDARRGARRTRTSAETL